MNNNLAPNDTVTIAQMRKAHQLARALEQQLKSIENQYKMKGGYKGRKKTMRKIHRRKKSIRR